MASSQKDNKRFDGTIEYIRLIDLIQVSCLAKMSHVIKVESTEKTGRFYLDEGKVVHAQSGEATGEEGFFELLGWAEGHFETEPLPEKVHVSINRAWEYLLIQAVQTPVRAGDAATQVQATSEGSQGFWGKINDIALTDLVQLVCLDNVNRTVEVRSDSLVGTIHVRAGQVCHAATEGLVGQEAFKMVNFRRGSFVTLPFSEDCESSIDVPWEYLLIEAMRFLDETSGGGDEKEVESRAETLLQKVQKKNISEKIRMAMMAEKEARGILIRDSNRMIQLAVLSNPKITDSEVAAIACSRQVDEEVLRRIAADREWIKNYPIRLSLAINPKTPVAVSRKLVPTLNRQDLRNLSRSKSVSTLIANEAKRCIGK
jgi:hypothetical protein